MKKIGDIKIIMTIKIYNQNIFEDFLKTTTTECDVETHLYKLLEQINVENITDSAIINQYMVYNEKITFSYIGIDGEKILKFFNFDIHRDDRPVSYLNIKDKKTLS